jgi:hypothetical protein
MAALGKRAASMFSQRYIRERVFFVWQQSNLRGKGQGSYIPVPALLVACCEFNKVGRLHFHSEALLTKYSDSTHLGRSRLLTTHSPQRLSRKVQDLSAHKSPSPSTTMKRSI